MVRWALAGADAMRVEGARKGVGMLFNTMVEVVGTFASDVVIAFAWTRLLRMRSNALFWLLLLPFMAFVLAVRNEIGSDARFLFLFMSSALLPFLVSVDRPLRKLLVIALVNVSIIVAEAVSISVWYLMTGLDIVSHDAAVANLGAFSVVHVLHVAILTVLFVVLRIALDRFDREETWDVRSFVLFPIVQAALLAMALIMGIYLHRSSNILYFGVAALSLVCLAADSALFVSMGRYARKRREDQRAGLLQRQLDDYLAQCNAFVLEVERSAKLRHDVRNQAHAALALADQGEFSRARAHLSAFRSQL